MRIKSFATNNGDVVSLEKINLFVGPNGVGKSQILRGIHNQMRNGHKKTVILDSINYGSAKDCDDFATRVAIKENKEIIDTYNVKHINTNLKNYNNFELLKNKTPSQNENHGQNNQQMFEDLFSKTKVAYLDASSRLEVAKSVATATAANPNGGSPLGLLQSLTEGFEVMGEELHKIFNRAFEMSIKLDHFRPG